MKRSSFKPWRKKSKSLGIPKNFTKKKEKNVKIDQIIFSIFIRFIIIIIIIIAIILDGGRGCKKTYIFPGLGTNYKIKTTTITTIPVKEKNQKLEIELSRLHSDNLQLQQRIRKERERREEIEIDQAHLREALGDKADGRHRSVSLPPARVDQNNQQSASNSPHIQPSSSSPLLNAMAPSPLSSPRQIPPQSSSSKPAKKSPLLASRSSPAKSNDNTNFKI